MAILITCYDRMNIANTCQYKSNLMISQCCLDCIAILKYLLLILLTFKLLFIYIHIYSNAVLMITFHTFLDQISYSGLRAAYCLTLCLNKRTKSNFYDKVVKCSLAQHYYQI